LGRLKKTLNIPDFEGSEAMGFPDGREEHGLGDVFEELEEGIGDVEKVLVFLSCFLEEVMESRIHPVHELIDSLGFKLGSHPQQRFPVGGIFDRFLSSKSSLMPSDSISFDPHFEMVRIGEDLTGPLGIRGRDGIAIGFKLDQTGFADRGQDDPIGAIGNRGKRVKLLFL
jgi:hypothetical protein